MVMVWLKSATRDLCCLFEPITIQTRSLLPQYAPNKPHEKSSMLVVLCVLEKKQKSAFWWHKLIEDTGLLFIHRWVGQGR